MILSFFAEGFTVKFLSERRALFDPPGVRKDQECRQWLFCFWRFRFWPCELARALHESRRLGRAVTPDPPLRVPAVKFEVKGNRQAPQMALMKIGIDDETRLREQAATGVARSATRCVHQKPGARDGILLTPLKEPGPTPQIRPLPAHAAQGDQPRTTLDPVKAFEPRVEGPK